MKMLRNAVVTTGRTCNVHLSTADSVEKFYVARTFFSDTHGAGTARRRFLQYLSYSHIKTVGIAEMFYGRRKLRGTHVPRSLRSVVTTTLCLDHICPRAPYDKLVYAFPYDF